MINVGRGDSPIIRALLLASINNPSITCHKFGASQMNSNRGFRIPRNFCSLYPHTSTQVHAHKHRPTRHLNGQKY